MWLLFAEKPPDPGMGYQFVYCRDPRATCGVRSAEADSGQMFEARVSQEPSVTLGNSIPFYRDFLGFNLVMADVLESFSGQVDEVSGAAGTKVRSCRYLQVGRARSGSETLSPQGQSFPSLFVGRLRIWWPSTATTWMASPRIPAAGMELLCSPKVDAGPTIDRRVVYAATMASLSSACSYPPIVLVSAAGTIAFWSGKHVGGVCRVEGSEDEMSSFQRDRCSDRGCWRTGLAAALTLAEGGALRSSRSLATPWGAPQALRHIAVESDMQRERFIDYSRTAPSGNIMMPSTGGRTLRGEGDSRRIGGHIAWLKDRV